MTRIDEAAMNTVVSRDGTRIAYWTSGTGPPLVLVHGTTSVHSTWDLLRSHLEPHVTVHAMDRRGRGASGDGSTYDLAFECDDVAAVVDAVAAESGSAVTLFGHSHGGACAWGAMSRTSGVATLILYEGWPPPTSEAFSAPANITDRVETLVLEGRRDEALGLFLREVAGVSEHDLESLRRGATWGVRVAAAHTVAREVRAFSAYRLDATEAARITVPVLMLVGANTPRSITAGYQDVAAALPDVQVEVLDGQEHLAHLLAPDRLAERVVAFAAPRVVESAVVERQRASTRTPEAWQHGAHRSHALSGSSTLNTA